jgi:hypothetical protein
LPGYVKVYASGELEVYENRSVLPRAFIVHEAEVIPSEEAVLQRLLGSDFDPSRTVILEENPVSNPGQTSAPPKPDQKQGERAASAGSRTGQQGIYLPVLLRSWPPGPVITDYSPHQAVIEADLQEAGFLVLSDAYYPGWTASVDGQESKIYQADYLFRAVPLTRGKHTVEFQYSPPSFRTGLAVTLTAGALFFAIIVSSFLLHRRRQA